MKEKCYIDARETLLGASGMKGMQMGAKQKIYVV